MKKRYGNEAEIVRAIDLERRRAVDLLSEAESMEATARQLMAIPDLVEDAKYKIELAKAKRTTSKNIIEKKLLRLGAKLAEMRTPSLAIINAPGLLNGAPGVGDESVSVKLDKKQ